MKQSPKIWYDTISKVLVTAGLEASTIDPCLFKGNDCLVAIYVDDLLICGKTQKVVDDIKAALNFKFKMKDLGFPEIFLGVTVQSLDGGDIKLSMLNFIDKNMTEHGVVKLGKVDTPMVKGFDPYDENSPELSAEEQTKFRSIIGTLLCVANSVRSDISIPISLLSQFVVKARATHLEAAYRVFHYLIETKDQGLVYGKEGGNVDIKDFRYLDKSKTDGLASDYPAEQNYKITVFSDSDYATSKLDRKLQSGHLVMINNQIVSWSSRKQSCVAFSSAEAEYVALSDAARTGVYVMNLLNEIGFPCSYINCASDNLSALTLSAHKASHQKTKHIAVRFHFIRTLVEQKVIKLNYVNTKVNIADILTKATDRTTFTSLCSLIFN